MRLQAACTADCLEPLPPDLLLNLVADSSPHVRRHALRMAIPRLSSEPQLASAVLDAAKDPQPPVRMQAAAAAASLPPAQAAPLLAELLTSPASDPFLATIADSSLNPDNVTAVFSSLPPETAPAVQQLLITRVAELAPPQAATDILHTLATAVSNAVPADTKPRDPSQTATTTATLQQLSGLLGGWNRRHGTTAFSNDLQTSLQPAIAAASRLAASPDTAAPLRLAAISLLGHASAAGLEQSAPLIALLTPRSPVAVQHAAVRALAQCRRPELASELLADWSARSPEIRKAITSLLLQRTEWTEQLLAALQSAAVPAAELDLNQRRQLLDHPRESIRTAAAACFNAGTAPSRREVIDRYAAVFDAHAGSTGLSSATPEQLAAGLTAFRKHCANCHRLQNIGAAVGPDIANYAAKSPLALITAVLDPNQAVDPRYQGAAVVLHDGRTLTGLITAETDNSLTMLAPEGHTTQLLRSEIDQLRSTGKSLMPENLEQTVTTTDLHLLWLWIRSQ
ncbi:MAG: HEAT repeat domain-containing protein [Planctomycetota bacterium]